MKKIEVVAAIIVHEDVILCVQRDVNKYDYISHKYEFPGGKIEVDESPEEALVREIKEELSMDILVEEKYLDVEHAYPDFVIFMSGYLCRCDHKELVLHEHVDYQWLDVRSLKSLDWAAADIPIVEKLMRS